MSTETGNYIYVCDGCGSIVTITAAPIPEGETWTCDDCGGSALWEFTDEAHARAHSRHIQRGNASGLFRGFPLPLSAQRHRAPGEGNEGA